MWQTISKQDNRRKARQHNKISSRFNHSQKLTATYAYALFNMPFAAKSLYLPSRGTVGGRLTGSESGVARRGILNIEYRT